MTAPVLFRNSAELVTPPATPPLSTEYEFDSLYQNAPPPLPT
jgi:hypothetical protein